MMLPGGQRLRLRGLPEDAAWIAEDVKRLIDDNIFRNKQAALLRLVSRATACILEACYNYRFSFQSVH